MHALLKERDAPLLAVECKVSDEPIDRGLRYLKSKFPRCDGWQLSATGRKDYTTADGLRAAPALRLLETLI